MDCLMGGHTYTEAVELGEAQRAAGLEEGGNVLLRRRHTHNLTHKHIHARTRTHHLLEGECGRVNLLDGTRDQRVDQPDTGYTK